MSDPIAIQPRIIVESDVEADVAKRLADIDAAIHKAPEVFQMSLQLVGELAVKSTAEMSVPAGRIRNLSNKPADLIIEFFRNRYDRLTTYDEGTEGAISSLPSHKRLLQELDIARPKRIKTGEMRSTVIANPEAVPVRDLIRISRFEAYLGRVAAYNRATKPTRSLPSAG